MIMENRDEQEFTVLCDDLTGTSVQSILLKDRGFSPIQKVSFETVGEAAFPSAPSIMVVNVNSRLCEEEEAVKRISVAMESAGRSGSFTKRIDTTLRGHLYAETAVMLEKQHDSTALVVPAYPTSGRITIGGYQLLDGALLERTEVSDDPAWPVYTSYVPAYFRGCFPLSFLSIENIKADIDDLATDLKKKAQTSRIIIADSESDADIEKIAKAAAATTIHFIPVDPGPFTAAYLYQKLAAFGRKTALAVVGSISGVTREQLEYIGSKLNVTFFVMGKDEPPEKFKERFKEMVGSFSTESMDLLVVKPENGLIKGREQYVARRLAELGVFAFEELSQDLSGVILSGGDTALRFFAGIGASFLEPESEIAPLMMGGRIRGTCYDGTRIVTKGGLVGGVDGLYRAVRWLEKGELR